MTTIEPTSIPELTAAVASNPHVVPVGGNTKPRLSEAPPDFTLLSTTRLAGVVEYEPSEFTFTALAGTRLRDIQQVLAERGQYLPFDPLCVEAGATLGGTVCANAAGPGRFRYGGIRDFLIAIQFVDGAGRILRGGAKVVKNAAGFDFPKFFVGSMGRFGVLAEVSFKVFPMPPAWLTLRVPCETPAIAVECMRVAAASRWECDAIEYIPRDGAVFIRLGGPAPALGELAGEIERKWPGVTHLSDEDALAFWTFHREQRWADAAAVLVKVPCTLALVPRVESALATLHGASARYSAAGNVATIALTAPSQFSGLEKAAQNLGLHGITLRGLNCPLWLGHSASTKIAPAIKHVFDPVGRFLPI